MWNVVRLLKQSNKIALLQLISPLAEMTYLSIRNVGEIVKTQNEVAVITYSPLPEMTYFQCGFFVLVRI